MTQRNYLMDSVRFSTSSLLEAGRQLPYCLSTPAGCPGQCRGSHLLMVEEPIALEIESGREGAAHLHLLAMFLMKHCAIGHEVEHIRTDGLTVWIPTHP